MKVIVHCPDCLFCLSPLIIHFCLISPALLLFLRWHHSVQLRAIHRLSFSKTGFPLSVFLCSFHNPYGTSHLFLLSHSHSSLFCTLFLLSFLFSTFGNPIHSNNTIHNTVILFFSLSFLYSRHFSHCRFNPEYFKFLIPFCSLASRAHAHTLSVLPSPSPFSPVQPNASLVLPSFRPSLRNCSYYFCFYVPHFSTLPSLCLFGPLRLASLRFASRPLPNLAVAQPLFPFYSLKLLCSQPIPSIPNPTIRLTFTVIVLNLIPHCSLFFYLSSFSHPQQN